VTGFSERYGPWALVAGASEGIGAAFTTALAGGAWTWFWSPDGPDR